MIWVPRIHAFLRRLAQADPECDLSLQLTGGQGRYHGGTEAIC